MIDIGLLETLPGVLWIKGDRRSEAAYLQPGRSKAGGTRAIEKLKEFRLMDCGVYVTETPVQSETLGCWLI